MRCLLEVLTLRWNTIIPSQHATKLNTFFLTPTNTDNRTFIQLTHKTSNWRDEVPTYAGFFLNSLKLDVSVLSFFSLPQTTNVWNSWLTAKYAQSTTATVTQVPARSFLYFRSDRGQRTRRVCGMNVVIYYNRQTICFERNAPTQILVKYFFPRVCARACWTSIKVNPETARATSSLFHHHSQKFP